MKIALKKDLIQLALLEKTKPRIIHKIFEARPSFHMKLRTTRKVQVLSCLATPKTTPVDELFINWFHL